MSNEQLAALVRAWAQILATELTKAQQIVGEGKEEAWMGLADFLDELDRTGIELRGGIMPLAGSMRRN